jgi:hypothetical protein
VFYTGSPRVKQKNIKFLKREKKNEKDMYNSNAG